jgi:hypothetical protein
MLLHTRTSRRHNHDVTDPQDETDDNVITGAAQPCLELERGPGNIGALFALAGNTHIGNSWKDRVSLDVPGMNARHARIFRADGVWYVQNVNPREGTSVNGAPLGADARPLEDGDRISLDRDLVVLRFRSTRPALGGVTAYRANGTPWVTFCPWFFNPHLAYAMSDDGVVRTAISDVRVSTFTSSTFAAMGAMARFDDGTRVYVDDVAGIRWPDLLWRTNEQRASVDGRLLFAAASLMMCGGDVHHSRMHVTWTGTLVWHARDAPPPRPRPPGMPPLAQPPQPEKVFTGTASRAALVVHLVATAAGCTSVRRTASFVAQQDADVLADHKRRIPTLPLDGDVRAALLRLVDTALAAPQQVAAVIDRERVALGALAAADVAGLVAQLFAEERKQHERIVDEARVLGVEGIVKLRG